MKTELLGNGVREQQDGRLAWASRAVLTNDDEDEDKDNGDKNDDAVIGFQILGHTGHFFFFNNYHAVS